MKSVRAGALLFRRKARRDVVPALDRGQVPCEGQDVAPMAVLMEQGADPRHIPGNKRRLEGREPVFGRTPGLLRGLKLKEGLIEIVHLYRDSAKIRKNRLPIGVEAILLHSWSVLASWTANRSAT